MTAESKKLDQLIEQARQGKQSPQPERDLWGGIEQALVRSSRRPLQGFGWLWASAACMVLVVAGLTFNGLQQTEQAGVSQTQLLLTMLNQQHQQQRQLVLTHYQQVGWDGRSEFVKHELEQIRASIDEVSEQLMQEPSNQQLWQLLQWLYQKELELLESQFKETNPLQQV
ncbi:hypothetical protein PSI9734_02329 [Pseudidiomarina piscicola]|uniref:Uncharacterized protein n=1 Tax=Pseudidiomarina piscicola TaxID=2614830 RepID=A0A6S6WMC5_9GAMM|nr:hypothetical protein [Pseudidiomarina piscicola]CAB0151975.1 hypothetical protein PSI9734_02329 [Pseudidiomarina piscicola]VZT41413.1 hypothetical protein PSI9734_02329 [Pseudomonas aeruginosa]